MFPSFKVTINRIFQEIMSLFNVKSLKVITCYCLCLAEHLPVIFEFDTNVIVDLRCLPTGLFLDKLAKIGLRGNV